THPDNRIGFVDMYSLTFFFANFGPSHNFRRLARLRSTAMGCRLMGITGAFGRFYIWRRTLTQKGLLGVVYLVGLLCTFLVPESKGKSLEEMLGEN
ncbi:Phosphate transporter 1,4, partial [Dorcoceras hygrometricum]